MVLEFEEYKEYLDAHLKLLYFVGKKKNIFSEQTTFKKFISFDFQTKFKCREEFYKNKELLDEYLASNFDHLSSEEVKILKGFKRNIISDFIIFKYLAKYAIFIDAKNNNFYAVKALGDNFYEFFPEYPILITTVILPFKDKIIYDGFIQSKGIFFGAGIRREMNELYMEAKKNKSIIKTL